MQRGALRQGDHVVAGQSWGKVRPLRGGGISPHSSPSIPPAPEVRLLLDEEGAQLSEAGPAVPVRVSGMREMPRAGDELLLVVPSVSRLSPPCNGASYIGDELLVVPSEARAKEVVEFRLLRAEAQAGASPTPTVPEPIPYPHGTRTHPLPHGTRTPPHPPTHPRAALLPGKRAHDASLLCADAQALAAAAPRRGRKGGGAKLLPALLKAESFGSLEAARGRVLPHSPVHSYTGPTAVNRPRGRACPTSRARVSSSSWWRGRVGPVGTPPLPPQYPNPPP